MTNESKEIERLFSKLKKSHRTEFPLARAKLDVPKKPGVYIIYSQRGVVWHVGMTPRAKNGLHQRLSNHMAGNSSFTYTFLKTDGTRLRGKCTFSYLIVPNRRKRVLLESLAVGRLCPKHIGHSSVLKK